MSTKIPFKGTAEKEILNCNILKVKVGTTGYCGGDSGHGGRTFIEISDEASTDWEVSLQCNQWNEVHAVRIDLGGDSELQTIIEALRFAADNLERIANDKTEKK